MCIDLQKELLIMFVRWIERHPKCIHEVAMRLQEQELSLRLVMDKTSVIKLP